MISNIYPGHLYYPRSSCTHESQSRPLNLDNMAFIDTDIDTDIYRYR